MSGRPRRAAAAVKSYAIPSLAELEGDSDSDTNKPTQQDDDNNSPPAASTSKSPTKSKAKAKATPKGKGKGKGKGKAAKSSSDSGSDFGESLAQQAQDPSDESEDILDDLDDDDDDGPAIIESDGSDAIPARKPKRAPARVGSSAGGRTPAARPLTVRANSTKGTPAHLRVPIPSSRPVESSYTRVTAPPPAYELTVGPETSQFGPLFNPPVRRIDSKTGEVIQGEPLTDYQRSVGLNQWAETPFYLTKAGMCDLGWRKGKWAMEGNRMNHTWGGWYPSRGGPLDILSPDAVAPFLPRNVYPARPTRVFSDEQPRAPSPTQEGGMDNEMEVDEVEETREEEVAEVRILVGGIGAGNEPEQLVLERFQATRMDSYLPRKPGQLLNAGGPVTGLAWCPRRAGMHSEEYLAVATLSSPLAIRHAPQLGPASIQLWSLDTSIATDWARETSDENKGRPIRREFSLCHASGEALELAWCPRGGDPMEGEDEGDGDGESLGLLAGAFADGSVSIFEMPLPRRVSQGGMYESGASVYVEPVLKLALEHTSALCFSWGSHETIAAGCTNGSVVVWSVGEALRTGATHVRPTHIIQTHQAAIRAITWILAPPGSTTLEPRADADAEPEGLITTGHDGSIRMTDLRDGGCVNIVNQERGTCMSATWSSQTGTVLVGDAEDDVRGWFLKPASVGSNKVVSQHRGAIWNIATSDWHPFSAAASADGACTVANVPRALRHKSHRVKFAQKLFVVDFNRRTGEYRMHDNLLPQQRSTVDVEKAKKGGKTGKGQGRPGGAAKAKAKAKAKKKKKAKKGKGKEGEGEGGEDDELEEEEEEDEEVPVEGAFEVNDWCGAWSSEVGVLRVDWFPGVEHARMVASGLACGLVRVDWVDGGP